MWVFDELGWAGNGEVRNLRRELSVVESMYVLFSLEHSSKLSLRFNPGGLP